MNTKTQSSLNTEFPYKTDIKTGSPRKLWRFLNDFLADNEYDTPKYKELVTKPGDIDGTATFSHRTKGWKEQQRHRPIWMPIVGFLLCLTIILIPSGIRLIKQSTGMLRFELEIEVEGELYRARGSAKAGTGTSEVLDVVADARIAMNCMAGRAADEGLEAKYLDVTEVKLFESEIEKLKKDIDELLQKIVLPDIVTPEVAHE
ncbi:MAG: hypothetical protein HQ553_17855 [Chloroflexi bacterium]|nr:hypothetical protein [Chloroflexota bacterium]